MIPKNQKQQQRPRISTRQSADSPATTSDCPSNKSKARKNKLLCKSKANKFRTDSNALGPLWVLSCWRSRLGYSFSFFFLFLNYYFYFISFISWVKSTFGLEITKGEREKHKAKAAGLVGLWIYT